MFFSGSIVFAQNIEGIGDFKIGMNINEFLENHIIKGKNIREKVRTIESPNIGEVLKITSNTKFDEYIIPGRIKDASIARNKIYSSDIEKYEFLTSLGIKDIYGKDEYNISIIFFKRRLIYIGTGNGNKEFEKILTEKYGKPIIDDKSKMEICQNGYGAKTEHLNGSVNHYWGRGNLIEARYYFGNFSCGKYPYSGYEVYSLADKTQVDAIQTEGRKIFESEDTKRKAEGTKL